MGRLCPSVVEECARAGAAIGVRFAGVDLITSDPGIPVRGAGGAIVDINTGPACSIATTIGRAAFRSPHSY